ASAASTVLTGRRGTFRPGASARIRSSITRGGRGSQSRMSSAGSAPISRTNLPAVEGHTVELEIDCHTVVEYCDFGGSTAVPTILIYAPPSNGRTRVGVRDRARRVVQRGARRDDRCAGGR